MAKNVESTPKRTVLLSTIIIIGNLFFFKYTNFFIDQISYIFGLNIEHLNIKLPLGISFISFQALGYIIDVYRKETKAEKNFFFLLLFLGYFPQLIAGPICRAKELIPQLREDHFLKYKNLTNGFLIFSIGLVLKVVFADSLAPFVDKIYNSPQAFTPTENFFAILTYGVQIFCDFWGYSTMAIGISKMFQIDIPINFNLPYISLSLQEFWRRWHITLSLWLRDYLYIPLGGSKGTTSSTYRNLLITMLLGGFWHGASWNFIIWGAIHGSFLSIERVLSTNDLNNKNIIVKSTKWFITMTIVFIAWTFFRAANVPDAIETVEKSYQIFHSFKIDEIPKSIKYLLFIFIPIQFISQNMITKGIQSRFPPVIAIICSFWLCILTLIFASEDTPKFIYFDF